MAHILVKCRLRSSHSEGSNVALSDRLAVAAVLRCTGRFDIFINSNVRVRVGLM